MNKARKQLAQLESKWTRDSNKWPKHYDIVPLAVESAGGLGKDAKGLLQSIGHAYSFTLERPGTTEHSRLTLNFDNDLRSDVLEAPRA